MVRLGQTFVNKEVPGIHSHLWMILSDPDRNDRVVLANLTTQRSNSPEACVVRPDEHRYVSRPSVIAMKGVLVRSAGNLDAAQAKGLLASAADLSPALLTKVQRAVGASPLVVNEAKDILREQGFL